MARPSAGTRRLHGYNDYQITDPTSITDFDDYSTWTDWSSTSGTTADGGDHIQCFIPAADTTSTAGVRKGSFTIDMSADKVFALRYTFADNGDMGQGLKIDVRIASGGDHTSNYNEYQMGRGGDNLFRSYTIYIDGDLDTPDATAGTLDWADITDIAIRVNTEAGNSDAGSSRIDLEAFYYPVGRTRPKIIFTFDDGADDIYDEVFKATGADWETLGLVGTCFIHTDNVGGSGAMTRSELQELYDAGWDLANHAPDNVNPTSVSVATAVSQYEQARDWLKAEGLAGAETLYASPEGGINQNLQVAMFKAGCTLYRAGPGWTDTDHTRYGFFPTLGGCITDRGLMLVSSAALGQATAPLADAAAVLAEIDKAEKWGCSYIFRGHLFVDSPTLSTEFAKTELVTLTTELVKRIKDGRIDVVTLSDFLDNRLSPARALAA